ncbi:MAG TPA: FAD-binding protein [Candidatus Acidoferrales bacterium]|nr:FAD-binding protein [Candidatus Acidoferrales bacterium]
MRYEADVLVIGSGAAGLIAAHAAASAGRTVVIADKSLIGRGGATIMAQMTTAVALSSAEPDTVELHVEDTLAGARGLAEPPIVRAICERGPELILEVEKYGVKWARTPEGKYSQVVAPGHSRRRCVYVDVLRTGDAISQALRSVVRRNERIRRLPNVMLTKIAKDAGRTTGALGFAIEELAPVAISANAVIVATGGLTAVYKRNSASSNMTGDGFVLAAEAGARLRDMEFVQFFPIAHLYPPLVHLDPIMWDPFRYKLGGRLLNGKFEEFMHAYSGEVSGKYSAPRDQASYAILSEVEAGRGSPHGGVWLDFRMIDPAKLEAGFGPVIGILERQGIDLTRDMVEVAPTAHYFLSGIEVDTAMRTGVDGLLACGEAIYGMHGANRLSGNAITEALVTGRIAGETAAAVESSGRPLSDDVLHEEWARLQHFWHPRPVAQDDLPVDALKLRLQNVMEMGAGPLRTADGLAIALDELAALKADVARTALAPQRAFAMNLQEKVELQNMIAVSEAIARGALARRETRGAQVRLDFPEQDEVAVSRAFRLERGSWTIEDVVPAVTV